jgi:hypothetical protein
MWDNFELQFWVARSHQKLELFWDVPAKQIFGMEPDELQFFLAGCFGCFGHSGVDWLQLIQKCHTIEIYEVDHLGQHSG